MRLTMSMHARRELVWSTARRYRDSDKPSKSRILDEFCAATGYSRKYALGLLGRPPVKRTAPAKRRSNSQYSRDLALLTRLWEVSGRLSGKRLVMAVPILLDAMLRHGETTASPEARERIEKMSASTADRLLAPVKSKLGFRGRTTTKPGTLLKSQIPIRTYADWDDARPGFFEVDLVAHCGGSGAGEFAYTLTVTDVATQWTELVALKNRSQIGVCAGMEAVRKRLPFPMLGVDSDNGSEFINHLLDGYCKEHKITFTRCRPYQKNDQCHVEGKNWSVVRANIGYWRYESAEAVLCLRSVHSWLRLIVNFFEPSMKLKGKTRDGAKVTRHHDQAATPYQRVLDSGILSEADAAELKTMFLSLNPVSLRKSLAKTQQALYESSVSQSTLHEQEKAM